MHQNARLDGTATVTWTRRAVDLNPAGSPTDEVAATHVVFGLVHAGWPDAAAAEAPGTTPYGPGSPAAGCGC